VLVTARSATALTVVLTVELLFPALLSVVLLDTFAVLLMVELLRSLELAVTTMVKVATAPGANGVESRNATVPELPAAGAVDWKAGPPVCVAETKVVPAGVASETSTPWASLGPAFVTLRV